MTDRTVSVHELLLALAGRLDDDLLAWARELLAVGEEGQAVELATAALAAERVALPAPLREALVTASRTAHTDLDVDRALPAAVAESGIAHRFDAAAAPGDAVVAVLTALPARRLADCRLHLTWRRTPAGSAPGPVPRAVVLVEADPDRSADVLAYLIATELDRADAPASVEVFTTGSPLPPYHAAALRGAREVGAGRVAARDAGLDAAVTRDLVPDPVHGAGAAGRTPATVRHETADPTSTPLFLVPPPDGSGTDRSRGEGSSGPGPSGSEGASSDPAAGAHRTTGRRRRPEPASDVTAAPEPAAAAPDPGVAEHVGSDPVVSDPDGPDTDPFHGPLRVPLLAPLLDPTGGHSDHEPTGTEPAGRDTTGPEQADTEHAAPAPTPAEFESPPAPVAPSTPAPATPDPAVPGPSGPGASGPGDVPAEWEQDWRTGEWAMPRTRRPAPPDGSAATADGAFDVFGTHPAPERDLPRRSERTGRIRREPGSGGVEGPAGARPTDGPSAEPGDVSLFESPTARVQAAGGRSSGPDHRGDVPVGGEALFGPRVSDVPLFDRPPAPDGRSADPAPDGPRPGRRRRPDEPTPGASDASSRGTPPGPPPADTTSPDTPGPAGPPHPDPEPSALLSGTERDLLAQLHADLARERRPRPYRRAGQNGSAGAVNGHHADGSTGDRPPDAG